MFDNRMLRGWFQRVRRFSPAGRHPGYRPEIEALEDRNLLSFAHEVIYPAGDTPWGVAVGNLDPFDAGADVAVTAFANNEVDIYHNFFGDGTLNGPSRLRAGVNPTGIAIADLTGNGIQDLVVADYNNGGPGIIAILMGNGNGTFQEPRFVSAGFPEGAISVAVGDFNNDGIPDLAVVGATTVGGTSGVAVLLGNGDGTFQDPVLYPAGIGLHQVVVADFNGDGNLDLAVANQGQNTVSVLLGNGDGTFQAPVTSFAVAGAWQLAVGDFNNDGIPDLVATNSQFAFQQFVTVMLGNGDGTFQSPILIPVGPMDGNAGATSAVTVADVNGDGNADIVAAQFYGGTVDVVLGNGDGTFQPDQSYLSGGGTFGVTTGDLNGDDFPDIVATDRASVSTSVLINNADWAAPAPRPLSHLRSLSTTADAAVATALAQTEAADTLFGTLTADETDLSVSTPHQPTTPRSGTAPAVQPSDAADAIVGNLPDSQAVTPMGWIGDIASSFPKELAIASIPVPDSSSTIPPRFPEPKVASESHA